MTHTSYTEQVITVTKKNQVLRNAFIAKPKCFPSSHTYVHTTLMFKKQFPFLNKKSINIKYSQYLIKYANLLK